MENKKYLVFRIDCKCSDTEYSRLGELLNNGYVIFNEYKFADFAVIILKLESKDLVLKTNKNDISLPAE